MIEVKNLYKAYGEKKIFDNFSHVFSSPVTLLRGVSGSGKTTLLRLIAGLEAADSGEIFFSGSLARPKIAFAFAEPRLFEIVTVLENVAAVIPGKNKKAALEKAAEMLEKLGISETDKYPGALSSGMAQRVSLARAFVFNSEILLLDEPERGLDALTAERVFGEITRQAESKTVIMITHGEAALPGITPAVLTLVK